MLMRRPRAQINASKRAPTPRGETMTLPAPIGGLNARDAMASMPNTDAIKMDNWFPKPTSVDLRNGYLKWSTGYPAAVESLMTYNGPTVSKLFAASGTAFYDATAQGAVGAAVVTGLANARWQHTNMGTPGGNFLVAVNGTDYPEVFNGTLWASYATVGAQTISSITRVGTLATLTTAAPHGLLTSNSVTVAGTTPAGFSGTYIITVTGPTTFTYVMAADPGGNASVVGTYTVFPAITGIDPRKFIHVNLYASRIFFVEKDSARVWYLPVNSVGGAALQLDFSSLLNLGGYIMAMATWTIDNAAGVNEYAVFISSEGEVLMYSGTDPSVAANWVKAGRFVIGRPVGRRCFMRVSSDVILLTSDGFMPMSKAMLTDRSQQVALSDKITNLVSLDLTNFQSNFGWQATYHPAGDKLVFNVPQIANSMQYQYVMNIISGSWCRFTGWNANVFATMADTLYFGSNLGSTPNTAFVAKADTGYADDGGYIFGEVKTAFQFFGYRGYEKQITMVRPIFSTSGDINAAIGMDMDFSDNYPAAMPTFSGGGGTPWNTGLWNTFLWGSGGNIKKDWQGVTGVGDAGALHMRVVNNRTSTQWQSVQYVFKKGRIL